MTYKTVPIKKLYYGYASIRDYLIKEAFQKGWDIRVDYKGTFMTIPHSKLNTGRTDPKQQKSKYNDKWYHLIDYPWKEDRKQLKPEAEGQGSLIDG